MVGNRSPNLSVERWWSPWGTAGHPDQVRVQEIGAFITIVVLAVWGAAVLGIHLVVAAGADLFAMTYVATLVVMLLVLVPLYWRRIRWAYLGGLLVVAALYIGAIKGILDRTVVLSWSVYNLTTSLIFAIALACVIFSVRAYRAAPTTGRRKTLLGVAAFMVLAVIVAGLLWANRELVRRLMWQATLWRIDNRLQALETLDERIAFLASDGELASVAAGIVVDDTLVWARAYGEADLETVYHIGSVTKPFVATAVLQLVERGLVDLDEDVSTYLPFSLRHPAYPDVPITVRMLLTHRAGLAHFSDTYMGYHMGEATAAWMTDNRGWHLPRFDPGLPHAEFAAGYLNPGGDYSTAEAWGPARPGTRYAYSTPGYDLLALLVEQVSGQPFPVYAREQIFDPLRMTSSGFSVADFPERVARPTERVDSVLTRTRVELPVEDVRTIGGGGMLSTVPDLARYVAAQLNQGEVDGVAVLEPETVALMQSRAVTFAVGQADLNQDAAGLGLGHIRRVPWSAWGHLYDMHGATGHGGSWFGYQGQMWFVREGEGGYGIVLLTNTERDFSAEARNLWLFAGPLRLQVLLMEEAARLYQVEHGR